MIVDGKGPGEEYVHIYIYIYIYIYMNIYLYESLCHTPEINTTLYIIYTSILKNDNGTPPCRFCEILPPKCRKWFLIIH